jgi:hypothetical protein
MTADTSIDAERAVLILHFICLIARRAEFDDMLRSEADWCEEAQVLPE